MLERILSAFALALVDWLVKRAEARTKATDATKDADSLRHAGDRLRRMRSKDDTRP